MNNIQYIENNFSKFILIKGKDSANFLQGLITNDIKKSIDNNGIYSCLLSPQGKFLADFFIYNNNEEYLIEIHEKFFKIFYDKINIYKLRSDISIIEIINLNSYIIISGKFNLSDKSSISFKDPRNPELGEKIYIYSDSKDLTKFDKFKKIKYEVYKEILMKNLIPHTVDDLIENKSLLLENNFQNINAIDWNKGCYIGQEITARMKYRSLLKKKIYVLELLSGKIDIGNDIIYNNINIGNVISKTSKYILCMLKINLLESINLEENEIKTDTNILLKFL